MNICVLKELCLKKSFIIILASLCFLSCEEEVKINTLDYYHWELTDKVELEFHFTGRYNQYGYLYRDPDFRLCEAQGYDVLLLKNHKPGTYYWFAFKDETEVYEVVPEVQILTEPVGSNFFTAQPLGEWNKLTGKRTYLIKPAYVTNNISVYISENNNLVDCRYEKSNQTVSISVKNEQRVRISAASEDRKTGWIQWFVMDSDGDLSPL